MNFTIALYFYPIFWLIAAIALAALEAVTVQMLAIWFAIGAAVTMFVAMTGFSFTIQLVVFCLVSVLTMAVSRPLVQKYIRVRKVHTNADSIVGTLGTVVLTVDNTIPQGRVHVGGLDWTARSESGEPIPQGEQVLIKSIEGVKVIVEKLT